jgi:hypothetical protein
VSHLGLSVVIAVLALGVVLGALAFRWERNRKGSERGAAALAVAVFAACATLIAYPLERAYSKSIDGSPQAPSDGGGKVPSVTDEAQPTSLNEAWGPGRPTYTEEKPAEIPALNSITDNYFYGDERVFLTFKNKNLSKMDGHWSKSGEIVAGDTYIFRYFVNAAGADNLKAADLEGVVAHARLPSQVGGNPGPSSSGTEQYCGFLTASNSQPAQIWSCGVLLVGQPHFDHVMSWLLVGGVGCGGDTSVLGLGGAVATRSSPGGEPAAGVAGLPG